jgi:hypothetical protein
MSTVTDIPAWGADSTRHVPETFDSSDDDSIDSSNNLTSSEDGNLDDKPENEANSSEFSTVDFLNSVTESHIAKLLAVCIGLNFGDWEDVPYSTSSHHSRLKPTKKHMVAEVARRYNLLKLEKEEDVQFGTDSKGSKKKKGSTGKHPKSWSASECIEWLKKHPNADNIEFVKSMESSVRAKVELTAKEKATARADGWYSPISYLRLYMILTHDAVKQAFLLRH